MTLPGGVADKLGNRYEKWWTLSEFIRMLRGDTEAIRIEEPRVDKAEFVVTAGTRRELHQVKRSHPNGIRHFGRPFTDTWQMDEVLFSTWERTVRPGDTIICLGDVAVGGLSGTRLARLRRAPGRKILVIGNHEINRIGCVDIEGFDEIHMTLYASGTPPLLLTHMPLYKVPEGCVNVHGHIHNERAPSWTEHINVSVEQLRYRPRPWKAIRELAKHLAAGVLVPGRPTAQRLTHMG